MASTRGRTALPLPEFLTTSLRTAGWVEMNPSQGNRWFRHPRHRLAMLTVVASNVPGDTDMVVAQWRDAAGNSHVALRQSADVLVRGLEAGLKAGAA